jgi:hypothetical protein
MEIISLFFLIICSDHYLGLSVDLQQVSGSKESFPSLIMSHA